MGACRDQTEQRHGGTRGGDITATRQPWEQRHDSDKAGLWRWSAVLVAAMMGGDARRRDGGGAVLRPTWFCGFEVEVIETGWLGDRTIPIFLASSFNFFFGL